MTKSSATLWLQQALTKMGIVRPVFARRKFAIAAGLVCVVLLEAAPAAAGTEFATGPFSLPEGITAALNGTYLLSDANNNEVYSIPANGGAVTTGAAMGFRVYGEIALPSGYAQSGQYLAYGPNLLNNGGVAALTGTSGLSAPTPVILAPGSFFTDAAVAPNNLGTIAQGQVILTNDIGGAPDTIDILGSNSASVSIFATMPDGVGAFDVAFAPTTFGADAGDLFVSDDRSGNLYVLNAAGQATLFATLPLPTGFVDPGLRQIAFAPAGFTLPDGEDLGGDLFVSIAAQNGGGGTTGEIDVLNAEGCTVAYYLVGDGATPLDPRGLFFVNDTTLLVANADPGIELLTPSDFVPGSPVPEPSTWAMMLIGFAGLGFAGYRQARRAGARTIPKPGEAVS
jgi:hypothetical protein